MLSAVVEVGGSSCLVGSAVVKMVCQVVGGFRSDDKDNTYNTSIE